MIFLNSLPEDSNATGGNLHFHKLIKEDKNYLPYKNLIESAVITYLKETNQYELLLKEQGDVMTPEIEQDVFCNCFGIDVYEVEDKLVSEGEYAKTL